MSAVLQDVPIGGVGGIETWRDAAEYLSLGCENVQITTAVMQYGYRMIDDLIEGTEYYLSSHAYHRISEIVGKALPHILPGERLDRESICFPIIDKTKCLGCGRCYLSCFDGGHQAIRMEKRMPLLDAKKCVGCHLCLMVCPVQAITPGHRVRNTLQS